VLHLARPDPVGGENEPGLHTLHPALEPVPGMLEYLPSSHRLQTEIDVAPGVSPYMPLGHSLHSNRPRVSVNLPDSHCMQVSLLTTLKLPGSHPLWRESKSIRDSTRRKRRKQKGEVLKSVVDE
jgi:hypothetical protein